MQYVLGILNDYMITFDDYNKRFWCFPCMSSLELGDTISARDIVVLGINKIAHKSKSLADTLTYIFNCQHS